jgi:cell division septation protein DedD
VIVPNFGGFLTHYVCARYDDSDNQLLPPSRTIGFNPQLKLNDHLLVQSYVEAYDISYPEALRRIESEVEEMRQHLDNEGSFELTDLGVLSTNAEGNYEFHPCEAGILTPTLYGLGSFEMLPIQATRNIAAKEEVEVSDDEQVARTIPLETVEDDSNSAIVIRMSWMRNMIATAVAVLLLFLFVPQRDNSNILKNRQESSFLSVPTLTQEQPTKQQEPLTTTTVALTTEQPAEIQVPTAEPVQTVAPAITAPIKKPAVETKAKRKSSYYTIVLASQTLQHHAERFIAELKQNGVENISIAPMPDMKNKVRVVYGSFSTSDEAQTELKRLRATTQVFNEAWIFHAKE